MYILKIRAQLFLANASTRFAYPTSNAGIGITFTAHRKILVDKF